MKNVRPLVCTALLLLALPAQSSSQLSSQPGASDSRLYVSLVKKHSVTRFLNTLATARAQVVVTRDPVPGALGSKILVPSDKTKFLLVELQNEKSLLPGERVRFENIALLEVPKATDPEVFASLTQYAETIADEETKVSKWQPESSPNFMEETAASTLTIDQDFLEEKLRILSGASTALLSGKEITINERSSKKGKENTRAFLKQEYEAIGFTTSLQDYSSLFNSGSNFIAEKVGLDPSKVVLLASHMDTVNSPGADDNGSGTIAALAIAAALKDKTLRYTLRIVAFDQEEKGLLGSAAYAKALNKDGSIKQLVGLIDFEMTGYDSDDDGAFHVIDCKENSSADLTTRLMRVVARDPLRLKKVEACTNRSDHASFWKYNVPAIVISQNFFGGDGNPCYHKTCDKVDIMNFPYMTRLTTAVGRTLDELLSVDVSP